MNYLQHNRFNFYMLSLTVLLCSAIIAPLKAQDYIAPISHVLPDAASSNDYPTVTFSLETSSTLAPSYQYTIMKGLASVTQTDFEINTGLSLAGDSLSGMVRSFGQLGTNTGLYHITVSATLSGSTAIVASRVYSLTIRNRTGTCNTDTYKVSLVLDASGSMNATASPGKSRWVELQETVMSYVPSLAVWMKDNDSLEVVHFQGAGATSLYKNRFSNTDWSDSSEVRNTLFGDPATTPGGGTPLGGGIEVSKPYSTATGTRNAAIVFTDGYENGCPLALPHSSITCPTITMPSTTFYAIGFAGHNQPLLNDLALSGKGDGSSAHTVQSTELDLLFQTTIPELFRGCTPRIVTFKRGRVPTARTTRQLTETFRVDSLVRKLTVRLKCRSGNCRFGSDARLSLNGNLIDEPPTFRSLDEVRFALDLPIIDRDSFRSIDGGGSWTLNCAANPGSEYELMVMVDDKNIAVETTVNNNQAIYVGDQINVRTEASYLGAAFNRMEAEAFLLRPGEDIGNLLSEMDSETTETLELNPAPGLSQSSLLAEAKIADLLARSNVLERLRNRSNRIALVRTADGRFTGSFSTSESEVSSHYRILVKYKGYQPGLDSIQGMTIDHFMVHFGRPQEIELNSSVSTQKGEQSSRFTYRFKPTNKVKNPIGPGQAQNILLTQSGDRVMLEDLFDGTYTASFNAPYGQRPKVEVYVNDFNKPVRIHRLGPTIGLSFHTGILNMLEAPVPFDGLSDGLYYEVDLTLRLSSSFDLEAIVGRNDFGDDLSILEGGLYAGLNINQPLIGGFSPRIQVGASYYEPDLLDGQFGVGARLGLAKFINSKVQIGLEGGGSYLLDSEVLFVKGGGFLKYYF